MQPQEIQMQVNCSLRNCSRILQANVLKHNLYTGKNRMLTFLCIFFFHKILLQTMKKLLKLSYEVDEAPPWRTLGQDSTLQVSFSSSV